jgi:glycosyltransferase involved in cell wall biosynthesis
MSDMPLVSIVIPAFNHESFVAQALDSTLESGLERVEVLVCDDASTDATPDIIQEWACRHEGRISRFLFIEHDENTGIATALNELIAESRGDIIHGLASDDYYLPGGLLAKTKALLASPGWAGAFCDGKAVSFEGSVLHESLMAVSSIDAAKLDSTDMAKELLFNWGAPANLISWRRSAFKIHGGEYEFDANVFCEDLDFAWWAMSREAFGYIPEICCAYRLRSWPHASNVNPVVELRDVAHVLAKYAPALPPQLADSMRSLALSNFYRAAHDVERADVHMRRFQGEIVRGREVEAAQAAQEAVCASAEASAALALDTEARAREAEPQLAAVAGSASWRVTGPLRWLKNAGAKVAGQPRGRRY